MSNFTGYPFPKYRDFNPIFTFAQGVEFDEIPVGEALGKEVFIEMDGAKFGPGTLVDVVTFRIGNMIPIDYEIDCPTVFVAK